MKKELKALTIVSISSSNWETGVGKDITYECSLPMSVCKILIELYENNDYDGFENLKLQHSDVFSKEDSLYDFESIFESHKIGEETILYMENGEEITKEEYNSFLEDGFNHECGYMCISDLDYKETINLELYGG